MIAIQTLAKTVATALTVSTHILVRAQRDLMDPTVKPVSKILSFVVSSLVQLWFFKNMFVCLRDRSQTLVKRCWCKEGALRIFDPCKGALKKITTIFPVKIDVSCFSMGLTRNFYGKKGAAIFFLSFFLSVWMGAPKTFRGIFLHQVSPLTGVCERSLMPIKFLLLWWVIYC